MESDSQGSSHAVCSTCENSAASFFNSDRRSSRDPGGRRVFTFGGGGGVR